MGNVIFAPARQALFVGPGHVLVHDQPFRAVAIDQAEDRGHVRRLGPARVHGQALGPSLAPVVAPPEYRRPAVAQRIHDKNRLAVGHQDRVGVAEVRSRDVVDYHLPPRVPGYVDLRNAAHRARIPLRKKVLFTSRHHFYPLFVPRLHVEDKLQRPVTELRNAEAGTVTGSARRRLCPDEPPSSASIHCPPAHWAMSA